MRIGIDAHILGKNKGGVERYVSYLVDLLPQQAPQYDFVVYVKKSYSIPDAVPENVRYVSLPFSDPIFQRSVLMPVLIRLHRLDALQVQRIAPPMPGCKVVLNVHDVLPLTAPDDYPGFRNSIIRRLTPPSVRSACRVVTVSETVRREIVKLLGIPDKKAVAIHNGVDPALFERRGSSQASEVLQRFHIREPYVLYIGAIEPRKNIDLVLRALKIMQDGCKAAPTLVITGGVRLQQYDRRLDALADSLGVAGSVVRTGFVADDECAALMQRAALFLAPSRGEGFDLPPLEAMACGIPVVCSDIEVHRELFSGAAAFFKTDSADNLAASMRRLLSDRETCSQLKACGRERAQQFTWENMACRTASLYREIEKEI